MYTVQIEHECACFKKSEYESEKAFEKQQDAYNYSNIVAEFMNEEFCATHLFVAQRVGDNAFLIRVTDNPNAGSCGTGGCNTGSGSCGC